jgi:hypothetical protein
VRNQVQQLRDFGLKGMGLFAHGGSKRKSERSNNQNFLDFGAMAMNSSL